MSDSPTDVTKMHEQDIVKEILLQEVRFRNLIEEAKQCLDRSDELQSELMSRGFRSEFLFKNELFRFVHEHIPGFGGNRYWLKDVQVARIR